MISVVVYINNVPIICRSARRINGEPGEMCRYHVDDGSTIDHHYNWGAARLAIQMLEGVVEP